jgi:hypothetical protein
MHLLFIQYCHPDQPQWQSPNAEIAAILEDSKIANCSQASRLLIGRLQVRVSPGEQIRSR